MDVFLCKSKCTSYKTVEIFSRLCENRRITALGNCESCDEVWGFCPPLCHVSQPSCWYVLRCSLVTCSGTAMLVPSSPSQCVRRGCVCVPSCRSNIPSWVVFQLSLNQNHAGDYDQLPMTLFFLLKAFLLMALNKAMEGWNLAFTEIPSCFFLFPTKFVVGITLQDVWFLEEDEDVGSPFLEACSNRPH